MTPKVMAPKRAKKATMMASVAEPRVGMTPEG